MWENPHLRFFKMFSSAPSRPLLRYHGGKWRSGKWILSHFPDHEVYAEPFGGGASVLLQKSRSKAEIYNDIDECVVNLFRVLRDEQQATRLIEMLRFTPFARKEFIDACERNDTDDIIEQARKFIIRSFMGFATARAKAGKATPTGFRSTSFRKKSSASRDWGNYPDSLRVIIERLQGVCIEQKDAFQLIPSLDSPETLFYIDPPYLETTRTYPGAYRYELNKEGHISLAELLHNLKGMAVLSGYKSELYDELYSDWIYVEKMASCDGGTHLESLWLSPNTVNRKAQHTLF
jgi:DNA adenine methylase